MEVRMEFHVAGELYLQARRPTSVDIYGTYIIIITCRNISGMSKSSEVLRPIFYDHGLGLDGCNLGLGL